MDNLMEVKREGDETLINTYPILYALLIDNRYSGVFKSRKEAREVYSNSVKGRDMMIMELSYGDSYPLDNGAVITYAIAYEIFKSQFYITIDSYSVIDNKNIILHTNEDKITLVSLEDNKTKDRIIDLIKNNINKIIKIKLDDNKNILGKTISNEHEIIHFKGLIKI